MKTVVVKELMVPIEEYATVSKEANLYEAVLALEKAQMAFDPSKHKHRAILVLDRGKNVVGKLVMLDILMALEPKYGELEAAGVLSRSGYSPEIIKSMLKDNFLWSEPFQFICSRASELKVSDCMEVPADGVYIDENATLDEAIHQLLTGRYQSLLVTREEKVVGILRLSDVFTKICTKIKTCGL
jgi:CBS domain-containing protein